MSTSSQVGETECKSVKERIDRPNVEEESMENPTVESSNVTVPRRSGIIQGEEEVDDHSSEGERHDGNGLGLRTRTQTAKMQQYQLEETQRKLALAKRSWSKIKTNILISLDNVDNIVEIQNKKEVLDEHFNEVCMYYSKLRDIDPSCTSEEIECKAIQTEALKKIGSKIQSLRQENASVVSSRHSQMSKTSKGSTSSVASRTEIAAKVARLKVNVKYHDLEAKVRSEMQKLELLKELEASEAELQVVDQDQVAQPRLPMADLDENEGKLQHLNNYLESHSPVLREGVGGTSFEIDRPTSRRLPMFHSHHYGEANWQQNRPTSAMSVRAKLGQTEESARPQSHVSLTQSHVSLPQSRANLPQKGVAFNTGSDSCLQFGELNALEHEVSKLEENFSELNPAAKEFQPNQNEDTTQATTHQSSQSQSSCCKNSESSAIQQLANILSAKQSNDTLPRPEPEIFKGDILKFSVWMKAFETFIEAKTQNFAERLFYLGRYTDGEAKDAVSGFLPLNTKEAYIKAKGVLTNRYGNDFVMSETYRKKLYNWPKIQNNDGPALRKFSDFLEHCKAAMNSIAYLAILDDPQENKKLLAKLPYPLIERWNSIVHRSLCIDEEDDEGAVSTTSGMTATYPSFARFCKFMKAEANKACNPISSYNAVADRGQKNTSAVGKGKKEGVVTTTQTGNRSFATETSEDKTSGPSEPKSESKDQNKDVKNQAVKKSYCAFCKNEHDLDICKNFNELQLEARLDFVKKARLCKGCLKHGHISIHCRRRKTCRTCNRYHPTCLHNETLAQRASKHESEKADQSKDSERSKAISHRIQVTRAVIGDIHSMIVPVWVHHVSNVNNKQIAYALLDDQSDACFIKDSTLKMLGITGPQVDVKLSTMLGEQSIQCSKISGLVVKGLYEQKEIQLPPTYSREGIPARQGQIPKPDTAREWPHLKAIANKLMPYDSNIEIGLLIGLNCTKAVKPKEIIPGNGEEPYAKRTELGWGIIGKVGVTKELNEDDATVHRTIATEVMLNETKNVSFYVVTNKAKEVIDPVQVRQMFELDFNDRKATKAPTSYEDAIFVKKMKEGGNQQNGHYVLPLPLRDDKVKFQNNRDLAAHRLKSLKRKLLNNMEYYQDYAAFMQALIGKGYAEAIPANELNLTDGKVWYIPHHGVYHPQKPKKLRVVFDCSAQYKGQSLNSHLLQGPDLTNNLTEVLCRFRQEVIAFVCDIEAMYHQVQVNPEHRNLLRFLWWKNGDLAADVTEYRMTVHLFGATSSPSVANFALKKTADDYATQCGKDAAEFIRHDFYVDDGLKSVPTAAAAIHLIEKSKTLCQMGGFKLHKFLSNSKEVLAAVGPEERSNSVKSLDISKDMLPIERTLGVEWCVESDTFQFRIHLKDKPLTRRGILSTVSSIFDPLGLVSPVILTGKRILQDLCRDGVDWDDPVPDHIRPKWEQWRNELQLLQSCNIPRCYKPKEFGEIKSVELHYFADASQDGYGQCTYIRMVNGAGQIHCALVMAKSRVTPIHPITVPRLELAAAVVSVKIHTVLKGALNYQDIKEIFWTDSQIVLGYICNDAKKFHVYVANRVQQIKDQTSSEQWKYVSTKDNPADYVSRGMLVSELTKNDKWWKGPEFLWQPLDVDSIPVEYSDLVDDPEVKRVVSCAAETQEQTSFIERLKYFSSWFRAKRATAVCLRIQKIYKKTVANKEEQEHTKKKVPEKYIPVKAAELQEAEKEILKQVQEQAFQEEISSIRKTLADKSFIDDTRKCKRSTLKKASQLYKLDPFMDKDGILRVGGRIRQADLHDDAKHPVILPKNSHITNLIICYYHQKVHHQGRGITMNEIRSCGYWIVGGSSLVSRHIFNCVICRKVRGSTQKQMMADLPKDRLESAPPFTYSAVDYFGPFYVKEGRKQLKRYGVLFTCMASRAVHLEVAHSLDTSSFLSAYRRFVCRRGPIRQLRCDQGTNFVGAKNELVQSLREMDQDKLRTELLKENCDWIEFKMNVPYASHMGGVWERLIRSVRNVLSVLLELHGSQLNDELLRTFMTEAEAIVNGRPLTVDNMNSPDNIDMLTPNALLTMKSKVVCPPPGSFERTDVYSRKHWRRVQYLANEFWSKWKREYLQSLQMRSKWQMPQRNLDVNDIVIVKDHNEARNHWKLGKVIEVFPDEDGKVRKVKVMMPNSSFNNQSQGVKGKVIVERPIHNLVLILEGQKQGDQGIPTKEPT